MILQGFLLLSSLVLALVGSINSQCVESCPVASLSDDFRLTLTPGESTVFCMNYQYYQLENVALFNISRSFCSTSEEFFDAQAGIPNIMCSMNSVDINGSLCEHLAVILHCEWLEDDNHALVSSADNALSVLNSSDMDLGLAVLLRSTNLEMTGMENCNVFLNISWNTIECNIEETHSALTDMCSGIGSVVSAVGTNTSWFVVENLAVMDVGEEAVLIGASTFLCKSHLRNSSLYNDTQLLCEVVSGNSTIMQSVGVNVTRLNTSANFLAFRCAGDWNIIDEGEARIVLDRNLTSLLYDRCQSLSASSPFYSSYASFLVNWTHGELFVPDLISGSNLCNQNIHQCIKMCREDVVSNGAICDTVVSLILDDEILERGDLNVVVSILYSLDNSSDLQSLNRTVSILNSVSNALANSNRTLFPSGVMDIAALLDRVLNRQNNWKLLQQGKSTEIGNEQASSTLLAGMEQFLSTVGSDISDEPFHFNGTNIVSLIERVTPQAVKDGYYTAYFPQVNEDEPRNFLLIPEQLLCLQTPNNTRCSSSVATALVQALPLYLDQTSNIKDTLLVNSPLLMLSVSDQANGFPIEKYPIELHLDPLSINGTVLMNHSCMFWDFNISDWSASGITTRLSPEGKYICTTTHLTSFAVLVGLTTPSDNNGTVETVEDRVLSIISYIGSGMSLLCLILSLLIFITCGKHLQKGVLLYIHINFCLSLCLALLVFMAGIETAISIKILCTVVAVLLHYLFLCAFCWMLAEGIMLYILVVKVFGKLASKWYYFLLLGWGLPVPVVVVSIGIQHSLYGTDRFCWLSTENGMIWAFVGPMLLIVCVNSVLLVLTVCNLVHSRKHGGAEVAVSTKQLVSSAIKTTTILLPLLGLTWILGIFSINEDTTVFAWLFTVCNSLQGFLFFVLHILRNQHVLKELKRFFCCCTSSKVKQSNKSTKNATDDSSSFTTNKIGLSYIKESEKRRRQFKDQSYSQTSVDSSSTSVSVELSASA